MPVLQPYLQKLACLHTDAVLGPGEETDMARNTGKKGSKGPQKISEEELEELLERAQDAADEDDLEEAIDWQLQAVAGLRQAGDEHETQEMLSIALYNLAGFYDAVERYDEAVTLLEEVVAIDERIGHEDLESDRETLEQARQVAAMSPEERKVYIAAQGIAGVAEAVCDGVLEALDNEMDREELAAHVDELVAEVAEQEAQLPGIGASTFVRAVAAVLRGQEPAEEVPEAFVSYLEEIRSALQELGQS